LRPSLPARYFLALTNRFPRWRPVLWRAWYNALAHRDLSGHLLFMNVGYDDVEGRIPLDPDDEPFRYGIQLYRRAVEGLDLSAKDLLEVGCGRGGGGAFFLRHCSPRSYTGVDISPAAIAWCQRHQAFPNARWRIGRADDIPATSASIDVVVNVESSHTYPSFPAFLEEVHRVLRPGGHLAIADLRTTGRMAVLESQLAESGLEVVDHALITRSVVRALDGIAAIRNAQIETEVPRLLRPAFRDFAAVPHSVHYDMLVDGRMKYFRYLLQKP
jgi:SAM-dependent methyltransferase